MDINEIAERLVETEQRSKSNTKRLDKLELQTEAVNKLATSVEIMVVKQETMHGQLSEVVSDVKELKMEPGKKWHLVVERAITAIVAAIIGFVLAKFGI